MDEANQKKWDQRFMDLAKMVASWSKDPSTKVGSVIVDRYNRVVSLGYNGFPRQVDDSPEWYNNREFKYAAVIHAEENAILFSQRDLTGCTIYVVFHPCSNCAAKIIQCGIKRVVILKSTSEQIERWGKSFEVAKILFSNAGVKVDELSD